MKKKVMASIVAVMLCASPLHAFADSIQNSPIQNISSEKQENIAFVNASFVSKKELDTVESKKNFSLERIQSGEFQAVPLSGKIELLEDCLNLKQKKYEQLEKEVLLEKSPSLNGLKELNEDISEMEIIHNQIEKAFQEYVQLEKNKQKKMYPLLYHLLHHFKETRNQGKEIFQKMLPRKHEANLLSSSVWNKFLSEKFIYMNFLNQVEIWNAEHDETLQQIAEKLHAQKIDFVLLNHKILLLKNPILTVGDQKYLSLEDVKSFNLFTIKKEKKKNVYTFKLNEEVLTQISGNLFTMDEQFFAMPDFFIHKKGQTYVNISRLFSLFGYGVNEIERLQVLDIEPYFYGHNMIDDLSTSDFFYLLAQTAKEQTK